MVFVTIVNGFINQLVTGGPHIVGSSANGDEYPAWLCQQLAIENDPVEIVEFPIKNGDFP